MSSEDPLTVLVLGVGGTVSQGILKALALSTLTVRVVAGCISPYSVGLFQADGAYISPRADDPGFLDWLHDVVRHERVGAILSGVEEILDVLAPEAQAIREATGAVPIVAPPATLAIGRDKLLTCRWLRDSGLPHPDFADATDRDAVNALVSTCEFPLLAKPRVGKAAEHFMLLHDETELAEVSGREGLVVQEHLPAPNEEFTAGCICDAEGRLRATIVMRRELHSGTTVRAEAGAFPEVRAAAERVVSELQPPGPCNVQLRLRDGEPVPFELNVRFSGTAPARARLGFNEVDAAVRHLVLGDPVPHLPTVTEGVMLRYWNEVYVAPVAVDDFEETGKLANPGAYDVVVEDWGVSR